MTENICYLSVTNLAEKIRQDALSPVTVVDAFLERIDERDDEINAFVTVCRDRAREAAKEAERAVEREDYDVLGAFFESFDILLSPPLGIPPFEKKTQPTTIDGESIDPLHGWMLTWPFNLTVNPAASIPAGFTSDGYPIGVQLVDAWRSDETVVAASAAFERHNPWHKDYPPSR